MKGPREEGGAREHRIEGRKERVDGGGAEGSSPPPLSPAPHSANNAPYRLHNERGYRYMRAARPLAVLAIMSTQIMRGDWCSMYTYLPSGKEGEEPRSPSAPSRATDGGGDAGDGVSEGCERRATPGSRHRATPNLTARARSGCGRGR